MASNFSLYVRIPGWAQGIPVPGGLYSFAEANQPATGTADIRINNKKLRKHSVIEGYARIERKWKKGDVIEVVLHLEERLVKGHTRIEHTQGKLVFRSSCRISLVVLLL